MNHQNPSSLLDNAMSRLYHAFLFFLSFFLRTRRFEYVYELFALLIALLVTVAADSDDCVVDLCTRNRIECSRSLLLFF